MDGAVSEDGGLIRDINHMDLNDNSTDPSHMALALGAFGIELNNASIPSDFLQLDSSTDIGEPSVGMEFDSDEAAKEYYIAYANHVGFGVRMNKSRRSRKDDSVIMRRFVCTREGFHSKRVIYDDGKKKRKRGTSREGCMAMIEVIRKDHGKWIVTKLMTEHTHMVTLPGKVRPCDDKIGAAPSSSGLLLGEKTSLLTFITSFDQAMAAQHEKEAQADFTTLFSKPLLRTPSPIEKQAAGIYTRAVFDRFQEEFVESLGFYADKIEDGPISRYSVTKEEDGSRSYIVRFSESDKKARCTCCMFEYSGILCRHILRVFLIVGVRTLSEEYVMKRWTRDAMTSIVLEERVVEPGLSFPECMVSWYNDLCNDVVRFGMEGAISSDFYKVAKAALQKAIAEVVAAKNMQRKGQQNMQRFVRLQKMQYKMPLPKLQPKKTPARTVQQDEVGRNKTSIKDNS
ncbi:Protein FAR1-RELATED SEQUENCE 3, partial [Ananas comosus]